ncbi:MAG: arsenic resistance N-acetyltransferase ArsN2 [Halolamina sp.]
MTDSKPPADCPSVDLVPATGSAVEWIHALLEHADLPTADLDAGPTADADGPALYVVRADAGRVGCIGIERYGDAGLLRSAAIQERHRGEGYGRTAVRALESEAREAGIETLYLLTTTARGFFGSLGYEETDRVDVPDAVRGSAEFSDLCPDTAVVMRRTL